MDPIIAGVQKAFPEEWNEEVERLKLKNDSSFMFSGPTVADYENIANRIIVRNMGGIDNANRAARGESVDASRLHPAYFAELKARGVTEEHIKELSERAYPDLSPSAALRKWTDAAARCRVADLTSGYEVTESDL
jgi:hypothetical protein